MATFTYVPDIGFTKRTIPRIINIQFGDGYSHKTADGINNIKIEWDVAFTARELTEATNIVTFFETHYGAVTFQWTPPDELTQYNVVCSDWSLSYSSPISRDITAKFTRVF